MDEAIYTLHADSRTYRGRAKELEAIRTILKQEAHAHWADWGEIHRDILRDQYPSPLEKSA